MKTKLLLVWMLLSCLSVSAQDKQQVRWGITVGLNGLNAHSLNLSGDRGRWGGHVGAIAELPFSFHDSHWYATAEAKLLLLRGKESSEYVLDEKWVDVFQETDAYYLHIPIHAGYKWALSRKCSLLVDGGPYMAVGLFGDTKTTEGGMNPDGLGTWGGTNTDSTFSMLRRFDWGLGAKVGVEFCGRYQVGATYDCGLVELAEYSTDRNYNFSFFLGYFF